MNDERALRPAADNSARGEPSNGSGRCEGTGVAIVAALEALEVGDQRLAVSILLAAIEETANDLELVRCDGCSAGFEWPGLLAAHHDRGCPTVLASELQRAA